MGTSSIGLATLSTLLISVVFLVSPPPDPAYSQVLWTWIKVGTFDPKLSFRFDSLALVMSLVVSGVGFLIHIYSVEFMAGDPRYSRFFAYMNLFVASMLTLVLADNLLLLYLGWEGVGLCSYLLIGFWFENPAYGRAAQKAFIVTRIGDTGMTLGLILAFLNLGTLDIQTLMARAQVQWAPGSGLATATTLLLLAGALGKSAQLPFQTWLPDAMAGPTPVSALIHAATMVTAGVYLIARTHVLFELAPRVLNLVAAIGAITLLISCLSALVQTDIKRVLAYSTMSQVGYMFLALGVGAWSAAIFHLVTHAFFKALLFLSAGAVIHSLHHEHNIFKMGGLYHRMPWVFWPFLIGSASLSAFPILTAGFYSKDLIISQALLSPLGSPWLYVIGLLGAFLTSLYSFRLVFVVFFGEEHSQVSQKPGKLMLIPMVILAVLSLNGGLLNVPRFLRSSTDLPPIHLWLPVLSSILSILGIIAAYFFYLRKPQLLVTRKLEPFRAFLYSGWGFDWLYDRVFIRPFVWFATVNRGDFLDLGFQFIGKANWVTGQALSLCQTGKIRWYAGIIGAGTALLILLGEVL